jgi:hypothetical protein
MAIFPFSASSHDHTKILEIPLQYLRQVLQTRLLVGQYLQPVISNASRLWHKMTNLRYLLQTIPIYNCPFYRPLTPGLLSAFPGRIDGANQRPQLV